MDYEDYKDAKSDQESIPGPFNLDANTLTTTLIVLLNQIISINSNKSKITFKTDM